MSRWRSLINKSGRLYSSQISDFWEVSLTQQDPHIPNLPLENPAAGVITLTAEPGVFSISGTQASLEYGRKLIAASGSAAVTGTAANLKAGCKLIAASDSIVVTGGAASLVRGRRLVADGGSVVITGTAAGLSRARRLVADAGSITVTGSDAALNYSGGTAPQPETGGSWTWVDGRQRPLDHYTLAAEAGRIRITGHAADLRKGISPEWLRRRRLATAALLLAA